MCQEKKEHIAYPQLTTSERKALYNGQNRLKTKYFSFEQAHLFGKPPKTEWLKWAAVFDMASETSSYVCHLPAAAVAAAYSKMRLQLLQH